MFTCLIRYEVDLNRLDEFEAYAHSWIALIEKYGGTHHGYFMPGKETDHFPEATFSFPGLGSKGPDNIAVALFSFPNVVTYDTYRAAVAQDPQCKLATERFNRSPCFSSYERNFLKPMLR